MTGFFSLLSKYFLQAQQEFKDPAIVREEKQTIVDEVEVNEAFEPANDAFSGLREAGDWLIQTITDIINQLFGNLI
jgi:hypothetical protein